MTGLESPQSAPNAGIDWAWMGRALRRIALPMWFSVETVVLILAHVDRDFSLWFFDARLYLEATRVWLAGGDPWSVSLAGNYFAAPPPTLVLLAPFALVPADLGVGLLVLAVGVSAILTVRLLRRPWWWLLFPPLVECVLSGNVHALLVPLILLEMGGAAAMLKIYAVLPLALLGRRRSLAFALLGLIVTAPFLPWPQFVAEYATISARLDAQSKLGLPLPLLLVVAPLVLLAASLVGRRQTAWLSVSALWPSPQFYYGTLAMPARSELAVALVALPVPGAGLIAVAVLAILGWRAGRRPNVAALRRWDG